jgi:N-acetylmuramoyl-L-alanine amidase
MDIWPKRDSNPKIGILRGIYHENMRLAGKTPKGVRPVIRALVSRKPGWLLPIALVLALGPFSKLVPSLSGNQELSHMDQPTAPIAIDDAVSAAEPDAAGHLVSGAPELANPQVRMPSWDLGAPADQNSADYSLLFSRDDPVRLSSLFGLDIKTIVIDPGHGGTDPGAIGAGGTKEKDITLDVALKLKEKLNSVGNYNVLLTRDSDLTLSLAKRVEFAKENKADLFISVHVNALPNKRVNAVETYYFGPPLNAETLQLAEQENKESHYSIAEIDAIIKDIGNTVKRQESEMLAAAIQQSLLKNVRHHDAHVRDFGIKMAPFVVLSQVEVPSVLVEISCLTKKKEEAKLASAQYRRQVAAFIEEGIVAYLETQHFKITSGEK